MLPFSKPLTQEEPMKRALFAAMVVVSVAACGDSDPSGPQNANVGGAWTYNATNLAGSVSGVTFACNVTGSTISLTQSGTTFSGTITGGTLSCSAPGFSTSNNLSTGAVANGTVNGNAIAFDIDSPDWHHTGTLSGASISGQVLIRLIVSGTTVVLNGNFTAVKR